MSLVVNNNMMAANTARNLNAHYGRLATSTQRLSSGLRVNSAADDAAGLAIRELQRADIAALQQGARNANDAISMIQVADGSLGIIDEKLIRMKELAEQAATGTYDSTQRLMIESEYQAMASEITRIANATDFNGTKLLDGTLAGDHDGSGLISEGKMKIHFGTGNDSAEDYYYVEIGECTSEALGLGNNSTWQDVQRRGVDAFKESLLKQIKNDKTLTDEEKATLVAKAGELADSVNEALTAATNPVNAWQLWTLGDGDPDPDYEIAGDEGFLKDGKKFPGNSDLLQQFLAAGKGELLNKATAAAGRAAGGEPAALAADPDLEKQIQDAAAAKVDAILKKFEDSLDNNTTTPSDQDTAEEIYTDAIAAAVAEATGQGFEPADATALEAALNDTFTANKDGLWDAAAGLDATVSAALKEALEGTINDEAQAGALAAAKAEAKKPESDADISNAIQKAFTDSINGAVDASPAVITDKASADQAIEDAVTAALAEAEKQGFVAGSDEYDALKTALDAQATTLQNGDDFWDSSATTPDLNTNAKDNAEAAATTALGTQAVKDAIGDVAAANVEYNKNVDAVTLPNAGTQPGKPKPSVDREPLGGMDSNDEKVLQEFWQGLRETERQKLQYAFGQAAIYNLSHASVDNTPAQYGISAAGLDYLGNVLAPDSSQPSMDAADAILKKALDDMYTKVGHMNFAGHTVETQEDAQMALEAINEAIISKDKIRAHLGAAQNRLENTVSNLNIQAENLQAAESRISDVDVATEMTEFVRNQILTQSAVAMLSQANSLPQMAMQLIGG